MDALQGLEQQFGRDRSQEQRWGPRSLDLDLLFWGELRLEHPRLQLHMQGSLHRDHLIGLGQELRVVTADQHQPLLGAFANHRTNLLSGLGIEAVGSSSTSIGLSRSQARSRPSR